MSFSFRCGDAGTFVPHAPADPSYPEEICSYFEKKMNVRKAAHCVADALEGVETPMPQDTEAATRAHDTASAIYLSIRVVIWALVLFSFFEKPLWCLREEAVHAAFRCADDPHYPTFNVPYAPRWFSFGFELACLAALLYDLRLHYVAQGPALFRRSPLVWGTDSETEQGPSVGWWYRLVVGLLVLDFLWGYVTPVHLPRPAPFLRVALLVLHNTSLRGHLRVVWAVLPRFFASIPLLVIYVTLYAWLTLFLFDEEARRQYFPTLPAGMWSLFVCLTTANFPDVMMAVYDRSRPAALFFCVYLLLGLYFGLGLLTAVTYETYTKVYDNERDERLKRRRRRLDKAYEFLARDRGRVEMWQVMEVFWQLNHNTSVDYIDASRARLMYAMLDCSSNGAIERAEFPRLCDVLAMHFERITEPAPFVERYPTLSRCEWLQIVNSAAFERAVDSILVVATCSTALATLPDFHGMWQRMGVAAGWVTAQDLVLVAFFACEAWAKVVVNGWRVYWRSPKHRYDLCVTVASVAAAVVVYIPNNFNDPVLLRAFLITRLLRLLRLLQTVGPIARIAAIFLRVLPEARRLLQLVFVLLFSFAALGVLLYGGRINTDPGSRDARALRHTAYAAANYYDFNFNDLPSGVVTLFTFLVLNNWFVILEGPVAVSSEWSRLYFVAFYLLGVLVALNIALSFIMTTSLQDMDPEPEKEQEFADSLADVERVSFEHNAVVLAGDTITGTWTGLEGQWRAVWRPVEGLRVRAEYKHMMRTLFERREAMAGARVPSFTAELSKRDFSASESCPLTARAVSQYGATLHDAVDMEDYMEAYAKEHDLDLDWMDDMLPEEKARQAVFLISDALQGLHTIHPRDTVWADRVYYLQLKLQPFFTLVAWVYVCLSFFEEPLWLALAREQHVARSTAQYPTFGQPFLPREAAFGIEAAFVALLVCNVLLHVFAKGRAFFGPKLNAAHVCLLGLALIDSLIARVTSAPHFRAAPFLRMGILAFFMRGLPSQVQTILLSLPEVASTLLGLVIFVFFCGWMAVLLFQSPANRQLFGSLYSAMWQLLVLLTTTNFPDVMVPAFQSNRAACVFFVVFVILAQYFAMNMITASVYQAYRKMSDQHERDALKLEKHNLARAFRLLRRGRPHVLLPELLPILGQLNRNPQLSLIDSTNGILLLAAIDRDGTGKVEGKDFQGLCDILRIRFFKHEADTAIADRFPRLSQNSAFNALCRAVRSRAFDWLVNVVVFVNAVTFVLESWRQITGHELLSARGLAALGRLDMVFTPLYCAEVALKIVVLGWPTYWQDTHHRFDFIVTTATVGVTLVVLSPNAYNDPLLIRLTSTVRLLRVFGLLFNLGEWWTVVCTFVRVLPAASKLLCTSFLLMYTFSAAGVYLFGGAINTDPASPQFAALKGSPFGASDYWANNFNDMLSGMVLCFELLVVNNWWVFVDAFAAVSSEWSRLFFIAYWLLSLNMLNIAQSFLIDAAVEQIKDVEQEEEEVRAADGTLQATIYGHHAVFNADRLTGTMTGLTGQYTAMVPGYLDPNEAQRLIHDLFRTERTDHRMDEQHFGLRLNL